MRGHSDKLDDYQDDKMDDGLKLVLLIILISFICWGLGI